MHHFSPVRTGPKLRPHLGPILAQIGLTRSQNPATTLTRSQRVN